MSTGSFHMLATDADGAVYATGSDESVSSATAKA